MTAIQDQVILVTGSTDGIGKQTAHDLASMGATVLLHGRVQERAVSTLQEIYAATGNNQLEYYLADFSSLASVRRLAAEVQAKHNCLNVLINNAGIGAGNCKDRLRALSQDGYQLRFAVNYLAPFLLTHLLLPFCARRRPHGLSTWPLKDSSQLILMMSCWNDITTPCRLTAKVNWL